MNCKPIWWYTRWQQITWQQHWILINLRSARVTSKMMYTPRYMYIQVKMSIHVFLFIAHLTQYYYCCTGTGFLKESQMKFRWKLLPNNCIFCVPKTYFYLAFPFCCFFEMLVPGPFCRNSLVQAWIRQGWQGDYFTEVIFQAWDFLRNRVPTIIDGVSASETWHAANRRN